MNNTALLSWLKPYRQILANAASLAGTTVISSISGFAYWWLAARLFSPQDVGTASAELSAMMLLGTISMFGLGTLLMGELPRQPAHAGALVSTALLVAGLAGGVSGLIFAWLTPLFVPNLKELASSSYAAGVFALGVSLAAIMLVADQAMIGLLRGNLQMWRNSLYAIVKVIALIGATLWFAPGGGMLLYATWVVGAIISLVGLVRPRLMSPATLRACAPQWAVLRQLGGTALLHHAVNLAILIPSLALPLIVTTFLSATQNASFYIAWMLNQFVIVVPAALSTVLFSIAAAQPHELTRKIRLTLGLSFVVGGGACLIVLIGADCVLRLFGQSYADQAAWCLRILAIGVFPLMIRQHYIAICRLNGKLTQALPQIAAGTVVELVLAAIGARLGGLAGLSLGWIATVSMEAVIMSPVVLRAVTHEHNSVGRVFQHVVARYR